MSNRRKERAPSATANARTVLGKIRKMLREEQVMEREEIRSRLRASRQIGACGFGGRKVYHLVHYLRRRGEILTTPTHVMAADLLPEPKRRRKAVRQDGPRLRRIRLAQKRERAVARRQERARKAPSG